jgi:hypothetical protein
MKKIYFTFHFPLNYFKNYNLECKKVQLGDRKKRKKPKSFNLEEKNLI